MTSASSHGPGDERWREVLISRWRVGQSRSMVGPGDPTEHLTRAEVMVRVLDAPEVAVDLGSGAGIPGLALAGLWPDSRWILIDAALRRVTLLLESVAELGWHDRVRVVHGRAEDLGRDPELRGCADLVTSRLFGPPAVVAECGAPFLSMGGRLAVTEPPGASGDRWDESGLRRLGLAKRPVVEGIQVLEAIELAPAAFPRRVGIPIKRPLF